MGSLRVADAVGAAVDRDWTGDNAYYLRLSNIFRAELSLTMASSEFSAGYGLRLVPDTVNLKPAPFHTAELRYAYATPRLVFALTQSAGIGEQTFLGAWRAGPLTGFAPAQDPRVQAPPASMLATPGTIDSTLLPGAKTLSSVMLRSAAALNYRWERHLRSDFSFGYQMYGGLGREAQRYLNLQQSFDGSATLSYGLSVRMNLVSSLVAARGWNSRDEKYVLVTLSETWQYQWSATTYVDAGVGISSRIMEPPNQQATLTTTPVAAVGLAHTLGGGDMMGSLRFTLTYAPLVDAVTGKVYNRLVGLASAGAAQGKLREGVSFGMSQSFPIDDPGAVTFWNASGYLTYQLTDWLVASASIQFAKQDFVTAGLSTAITAPSGVTWGAYGGLAAALPTVRL